MTVIQLPEVLRRMESGEEFNLVYYSYDKQRKQAGRKIEITRGFLTRSESEKFRSGSDKGEGAGMKRPDHFTNQSRNIGIRGTTNIRKAKIFLITEFNGLRVIW